MNSQCRPSKTIYLNLYPCIAWYNYILYMYDKMYGPTVAEHIGLVIIITFYHGNLIIDVPCAFIYLIVYAQIKFAHINAQLTELRTCT